MADAPIQATLYADPACPWGYSAVPALRVVDWRYGDQIDWRLVMIGLADDPSVYADRGFTPTWMAQAHVSFRRYGMPFATHVKERIASTGLGCRAVIAARLASPGDEWRVLRGLQLANFTTSLLADDPEQLAAAVRAIPGIDAETILAQVDTPEVAAAYEHDKDEARSAVGSPTELQGKAATAGDGRVRYTAPSVVFTRGDLKLEAGGFQPAEAYDVVIANLDPSLRRADAPETPLPLLERFADGLTTQEVTALMTRGNDAPDRDAARRALLELVGSGAATATPLGDDALWRAA